MPSDATGRRATTRGTEAVRAGVARPAARAAGQPAVRAAAQSAVQPTVQSYSGDLVLKVTDLKKDFKVGKARTVSAVNGVSFEIRQGETFGLVGESGSGKSTIGRTIIRLYSPTSGRIEFDGADVSGRMEKDALALLRTRMQMIFQDPSSCLNPRRKVGDLVAAGLDINHRCASRQERARRICTILEQVGLSPDQTERYPQQFSGGQKQRIGIARALVMDPRLIIADEPISALDVSIQAQIVNLMRATQEKTGTAYLFISHDLSMVKYISDRIGVLHKGYLVETGLTQELFDKPLHPYTKSLLSAIPRPNPLVERFRQSLAYDYASSGIDYAAGGYHHVSPTHKVLATEKEIEAWG